MKSNIWEGKNSITGDAETEVQRGNDLPRLELFVLE